MENASFGDKDAAPETNRILVEAVSILEVGGRGHMSEAVKSYPPSVVTNISEPLLW